MERTSTFDESAFHLRRGFRLAIAALILCAGVLLAQDVLPSAAGSAVPPAAAAADARVGSWATPVDYFSSLFAAHADLR
jgi:hypothetical protein